MLLFIKKSLKLGGATFIKVFVFLIMGILIFGTLQYLFVPKRFPYTKSYDFGKLPGYYSEENNSIDVLLCGTSHVSRGILPMELYEMYGIKSYNLATSGQPLELSYYLLHEALKTQSPQMIVLDVSGLYKEEVATQWWLMLLDEMQLSKNKIEAVQCYSSNATDIQEILFPLLRYHSRWKCLDNSDFITLFSNKHYYGKGGHISSVVHGGVMSVELMNSVADEMLYNTEELRSIYNGEEYFETRDRNGLYKVNLPENNVKILLDIKALCDEKEITFLAVKVPSVYWPNAYSSSWTEEKYQKVRELCDKYGIKYYDLLYETDINLNLIMDSDDWGCHLNINGAQKVSADLGNYLVNNYKLPLEHEESWDRDLLLYQKAREVAQLQSQQDFVAYIETLSDMYKDKMIFIAAASDMATGLNEEEINSLKTFGLRTDFLSTSKDKDAYIAVAKAGKVQYEELSNREINYEGLCEGSGNRFSLYSASWWKNSLEYSSVSIKIANLEYTQGGDGIHIVVYDDEKNLVLDSVCFNTSVEYHPAIRSDSMTNKLLEEYEQYIMEVESR